MQPLDVHYRPPDDVSNRTLGNSIARLGSHWVWVAHLSTPHIRKIGSHTGTPDKPLCSCADHAAAARSSFSSFQRLTVAFATPSLHPMARASRRRIPPVW